MSIILRALKKIQNQEAEEKQGEELSSGFSPAKAHLSGTLEPPAFASEPKSYSGKTQSPDFPETAERGTQKNRISRVPRLLIGMLIVLGIISTGWFFNIIHKNYSHKEKVVQQARPEAKKVTQPAQPEPESAKVASEPAPAAKTVVLSAAAEAPSIAAPSKPPVQPVAPSAEPAISSPQGQPVSQEKPKTPQADERQQPKAEEPEMPVLEPGIKDPSAFAEASNDSSFPSKEASFIPNEEPAQKKERPELKINAIAWRSEEPKAIVNMQRVYVGDVVDGALVKQIGRKSVIFEFEGEEFEVRF